MIIGEILGIIAGILSFFAYGLYIFTTIFGRTKPNRATWWILTLIGLMVASSYYAGGARATMWVAVSYVLGPFIIAVLSLKYGEGRWEGLDKWCLVIALISVPIWYISKSAILVLMINIFLDFIGLLPTIKKSYLRPQGEDRIAWTITFFASLLNIFAVERLIFAIAFYPIYLLTINGFITALLYRPIISKYIQIFKIKTFY